MAPDQIKPPPRTLNVQKFSESRAPELESLHNIISHRLNHDFRIRRSKRRRTTGYRSSKNKIRKRRKIGDRDEPSDSGLEKKDPKKISRRIRRRMEFQKNPELGFCTSGDGTKRLRTHLWHAKRFTMVKRWGFYLPLGLHGRGRGSRAVLKWLKFGALVHDASYCHPIQLEGPEDSILAILRMVLLPLTSGVSEEISHSIEYGVCYKNAMLYHVGTPLSQFIAPVIYMWRPFLNEDNYVNAEQDHVSSGCSISGKSECSTSSRQLWIWIHSAAFEEGFDALRTACQKQMHESGVSVSCFSLEGHFAKLEIMGSKAIQILQNILHPVSETCSTSDHSLSRCSYLKACTNSHFQKPFVLEHAEHLPSHAILSLTVTDPRDLPCKGTEAVPETTTRLESDLQEEDIENSNALISGASAKSKDEMLSLWSKPEVNGIFLSDSRHLWDSSEKLNPPIPENILCMDRHRRRLNYFYLDSTNDEKPATEARDGFGQSCSILLLKHANQGNCHTGWSIVLPLSWVKAFWISLVSHGAHAIGLRERRWIACNSGLPSFPFDFPDCKAYSLIMAAEAAASNKSAELRPAAVRPSRVPMPPPWDCIASTLKKGLQKDGDIQTSNVQPYGEVAPANSSLVADSHNESSSSGQSAASFKGFIPRTCNDLSEYLEKIRDGSINLMPAERGLCLVRVLLHAYKEGVFEEGAIVCAPILTDLSRWESRLEEQERLQIPQALVKSYFTERDSGKWELQLLEDCSIPESYRWPIGFVTTGFVRGSTKPVAVAFCEAELLSQLREQQSRQMTEKVRPEIFVLVRNLRSAAYRRALATIVLEKEKEDMDFM